RPVEGDTAGGAAGSGGRRLGAAPLRDTDLLGWCTKLISELTAPPPDRASVTVGEGADSS
ncbi:MAG: hypothetical protein J2P20_12730, partial [Pseudonocardia sp.]|nr:hypothetical protein [Pseudonocardia sp.]